MARRTMILVAAVLAVVSIAYGIRAQTPTLAPPREVYFAQKAKQEASEAGEAMAEDTATSRPAPARDEAASLSRFTEVPLAQPGVLPLNLDEVVPEPPAPPDEPAPPQVLPVAKEPARVP